MKIVSKVSLILLFLGTFVFSGFTQERNLRGSNFEKGTKFFIDLLDYYSGNPDSTLVSAFVEVPYNRVQFFKKDNQFVSNFTIDVSIFDEDGEHLITESVWEEKVVAKDFKEATSKSNYDITLRNFMLKPDKYSVRASVEDKNSKNTYVVNKQIEVKEFSEKLDISSIMMVAKRTKISGEEKILPNVSRNVVTRRSGIPVFYEVNSNSKGKFRINYSVETKSGGITYKDTVDVNLDKGKNQIYYILKDSSLNLGTYTININIENQETNDEASVSCSLISRWSGIPENVTNVNLAIKQLVYLASKDEMNYIEEAPNRSEKIKRFSDFWKKKDPNPNDGENQAFDEYYNRIAFANDHFSTHYMDGWRTDRGMVYIVLGKPDDVEHHPFDSNSKPYEIWWYYNLNGSFTFLDQTGFGDYRLMNPLDFDYIRDRANH